MVGQGTFREWGPRRAVGPATKRAAGCGLLVALGLVYAGSAVLVPARTFAGRLSSGYGVVVALGLVWAAAWLYRGDLRDDHVLRIASWAVAGYLLLVAAAGFVLFEQTQLGGHVVNPVGTTHQLASVGAVGGLLTGFYEVRLRAEATSLTRRADELEATLGASPVAIVQLDLDGTVVEWNPAAEELFGWSREEVVGEPLPFVPPDSEEEFRAHLEAVREGESLEGVEATRLRKDGSTVRVRIWTAPLHDDDGVRGTVAVILDRTTEKRREQQLAVLNRVLRHNLRNDVNVIVGLAEQFRTAVDGEETSGDVDWLNLSARIQSVATDIAAVGEKARAVETVISETDESHPQDVVAVAREIVDDYGDTHPSATVRLDASGETYAMAPDHLGTAVEELVENALVHSDRDDPTVVLDVGVADGTVELSVRDDGPGIPQSERQVLGEDVESPLEHASGLGLWLVSWVADVSGGDLHIEDADPRGTVVTLSFPATEPPDDSPARENAAGGPSHGVRRPLGTVDRG